MHFTILKRTFEMQLLIRTWKRKPVEKYESLVNFRRIYMCIFMNTHAHNWNTLYASAVVHTYPVIIQAMNINLA